MRLDRPVVRLDTPDERRYTSRLVRRGAVLTVGVPISILGLRFAVQHEGGAWILFFGLLSITLVFGSSLCLFSALARFVLARLGTAFVIHFSPSTDRIIMLVFATFFAGLTVFFASRSTSANGVVLAGSLAVVLVVYSIHLLIRNNKSNTGKRTRYWTRRRSR